MQPQEYCSFCGKHQKEVERLIDGPAVAVCNECIDLMHFIVHSPSPIGSSLLEDREVARKEKQ